MQNTTDAFSRQVLSPTVTLYSPSTPDPTSIILLCPWMGAPSRSISKYLLQLQSIHPDSLILVCRSFPKHIFAPQSWTSFRSLFFPAIQIILAHSYTNPASTTNASTADDLPIKAFIFSNGGVHTLCHIAKLYREEFGRPIPLSRTILDSAPGDGDLVSAQRALTASLPPSISKSPIYRLLASVLAWFFMGIVMVIYTTFRIPNPVNQGRQDLNDTRLFNNITRGAASKRVYMYGPGDLLCSDKAITTSAGQAREAGWEVKMERFEKSGHVRHAVVEPERYWEIIKREL